MARPSLHLSKCHIVGNLMHWLICLISVEGIIVRNICVKLSQILTSGSGEDNV